MPENTTESITVVGSYDSTSMRDIFTGYTVFFLKTTDAVDKQNKQGCIKVSGVIPEFGVGTPLEITGTWETNKFGTRLVSTKINETSMDSHLMLQYLSSSMFPGIGLAAASEIVDAFGKDLYNKVNEPNAVEQICGKIPSLKPQPVKNMVSILRNNGAFKELFDYVTAFGGNYAAANKLYSQYGADAIQMLRDHPYQYGLTNGLKFATCDQIACDNGLDAVCNERLRAIIRNALILKSSGGGHVFASWHDVSAAAVRVQKDNSFGVNIPECVLLYGASRNESLTIEDEQGNVIRRAGVDLNSTASVLEDKVYLTRLYDAEVHVAREISRLVKSAVDLPYTDKLLEEAEQASGMTYAPEQRAAFNLLRKTGVGVLTGGPGTGKTTVICGILDAYRKMMPDAKILLAAPTGRAAQRMAESTGCEAITIHRLLEYVPYSDEPKRNATNPLDGDLIVIDESSMVDIELASMLLSAVKDGALLLFVGDVDQLPAVGAGDVLRDLIKSQRVRVAQLKAVFRQKGTSPIVSNAYSINNGILKLEEDESQFVIHKTKDIRSKILSIVKSEYNADDPYGFQILCPTHKGEGGEQFINELLQNELNPRRQGVEEIRYSKRIFRVGDKVLLTRNNYDEINGYYNGDVGIIQSISPMTIDISGRTVTLSSDQYGDMSLAYAMTVHKSQGSEFKTTVVVLSEDSPSMLQRNLLYTAVTRAKKKLILVYTGNSLDTCIKNNVTASRNTRLQDRLIDAIQEPAQW